MKRSHTFNFCVCYVTLCVVLAGRASADEPAAEAPAIASAIKTVLATQAEAWNRGSIDDFMEHYWKSDQLTFSSGGKTTRGWTATKESYKRRYSTPELMGKVAFDEIEVTPLGESAAMVLGKWSLKRETDPVGGNFSLVFRRIENRWVIIHDHTSKE